MSRTILAFLAVAATASADIVLESDEYWTYGHLGFQNAWVLQRNADTTIGPDRRAHVQFDIPDIPRFYSSATLRIPLGLGYSRDPVESDVIIWLNDSAYSNVGDIVRFGDESDAQRFYDFLGTGSYYGHLDLSADKTTEWETPRPPAPPFDAVKLGEFRARAPYHDVVLSGFAVNAINTSKGRAWGIGAMILDDPIADAMTRLSMDCNLWIEGCRPLFLLELDTGPLPPAGDFDGSGDVGQADLDHVLLNWGIVSQVELDMVLLTWGHGPDFQGASAAAVPEPSTWLLACVIMAAGGLLCSTRHYHG